MAGRTRQSLAARARTQPGTAALERLYEGHRPSDGRGTLLLDVDDVFCLGRPYGGTDVVVPEADRPDDLFERLWHAPAVQVLLDVLAEHRPRVVLTTSWLRLLDREGFDALFRATGLGHLADSLHDHWEAPANPGWTRYTSIESWLTKHYQLEPLVVLDDEHSGTGLRGSPLDRAGCVVLCEANVGLHAGHLPLIRRALSGQRDGSVQRV